jgi:hypothetical protein
MNSRIVTINGINLHVVELGNGPAVFLCHGFPEVWIEEIWRDQLIHFGQQNLKFLQDLPAAQVSSKPCGERTRRSSSNMARARCNALLTAGWLSSSRADALMTLFSSAITAKIVKRFKSTCRSFSKRIQPMSIMHEPYAQWKPSIGVAPVIGQRKRRAR